MKDKRKPIADLPRGVGVSKVSINGYSYWRIRLGKKFTGGEIRVAHRNDLDSARKFIFGDEESETQSESPIRLPQPGIVRVQKKLGAQAFELTAAQLGEAQSAFRRLPPNTSLTQIVDDWFKRCAPAGGVKTTREVGDEFLISRKAMGVRSKSYSQYKSQLSILSEEFGEMSIADVERSHIEDWLSESEWAPRTRRNYLVAFTTLFTFAQDREYCPGNPAARIERPILDDRPPGILTVDQARKLLLVAQNGIPEIKGVQEKFLARPEMVPGLAIGLFAGLRRSEICRLDWSEIDLKSNHIEVKGIKAKTRQRRIVTIGKNLSSWLKPFRQEQGPVAVSASEDVFGENLREIAKAAGIKEWPHNGLRHSFGSYFYAKTKDENQTAAEMGNSPNVVFKHYRALVRPEAAKAYWSITASA